MPTIKVNDIDMYYEIYGEGEPLVFIVGLATDISEYDGIIPRQARGRGQAPPIRRQCRVCAKDGRPSSLRRL